VAAEPLAAAAILLEEGGSGGGIAYVVQDGPEFVTRFRSLVCNR